MHSVSCLVLYVLADIAFAGGSNRKQAIANGPIEPHNTYYLGVPFPQALAGVFLGIILVGIGFMGIRKSDRRQEERRLEAIFSFFRTLVTNKGSDVIDIEVAKVTHHPRHHYSQTTGNTCHEAHQELSGDRKSMTDRQHTQNKTKLFGKKKKPEEPVRVLASSCDSNTVFM